MLLILVWLILAAVVGFVASSRGRSGFGFFLLSVILSPLVGLLLAILMGDGTHAASIKTVPGPSDAFRTKWPDLARYDPDIAPAVSHLSQYGHEAVLRFRDAFAALNDKRAIPAIVADIEQLAQSIKDPSGWVPSGFARTAVKKGVPIYRSGNIYWVAGEHFTSADAATAHAFQLARGA